MPIRARRAALPTTILAIALATTACSTGGAGTAAPATGTPPAAEPSALTSVPPVASGAPAASGSTAGTPGPASPDPAAAAAAALASRTWATATLTDVSTGEPFTISSLAGRTIFVEAMAIWCSNCRAQQGRFADALARLDPDRVAYVVLTVDPGESADELARYKADRGFTGRYAVAGRDVAAALEAEFGPNVLNPPSVPLILVTPSGEVSFSTGGESADEIVSIAGG